MKDNIMYISRRFETNICATIHLAALKELYNENLYIVDLRTEGKRRNVIDGLT